MTAATILLTGSTGFVGQATLDLLARESSWSLVRLMVHQSVPAFGPDRRIEHVTADLADPESLAGICDGIDTLLHLATDVSDDVDRCECVNARGTEALVASASASGVKCLIYLSTAAVYGYAVHRGADERQVMVAPASPVSRSRARAEQVVLRAGGAVVRPLFVYGRGDTRFIPTVLRTVTRLPFLVNRGRAELSVIAVEDLASALANLARMGHDPNTTGPFHATDGCPISFRDLVQHLSHVLHFEPPRRTLPYPVARLVLHAVGSRTVGARRWSESAAHRLFLVSDDHSYDSSRLWSVTRSAPGAAFAARIGEYADWYRQFLPPSNGKPARREG